MGVAVSVGEGVFVTVALLVGVAEGGIGLEVAVALGMVVDGSVAADEAVQPVSIAMMGNNRTMIKFRCI